MNYTDAVLTLIHERAQRGVNAEALGMVEAAISLIERAFMSAEISHPALSPQLMGMWARSLLSTGNSVGLIRIRGGAPTIIPAIVAHVVGTAESWWYRLDIPAPSQPESITSHENGVVHVRYAPSIRQPWIGRSPLQLALETTELASLIEIGLQYEASVPIGRIIPIPEDADAGEGEDEGGAVASLKQDLQDLRGGVAFPETTQAGYGVGPEAAPQRDWVPIPIGPKYDQGVVEARDQVARHLLSALGVPPSLVIGGAEGTADREDWRRCLHGTILPLASLFRKELTAKLGTNVQFDFSSLAASDLAGRARAFQSMVGGGMSVEQAATQSGLTQEDA